MYIWQWFTRKPYSKYLSWSKHKKSLLKKTELYTSIFKSFFYFWKYCLTNEKLLLLAAIKSIVVCFDKYFFNVRLQIPKPIMNLSLTKTTCWKDLWTCFRKVTTGRGKSAYQIGDTKIRVLIFDSSLTGLIATLMCRKRSIFACDVI